VPSKEHTAWVVATIVTLATTACGLFTVRAKDIVWSKAEYALDCPSVVVTMQDDGSYRAAGCGKTRQYVCDREVATGVSKPGAIAAVGCRPAAEVAAGAADAGPEQPPASAQAAGAP
jgi:hypothetical protein